MPYPSRHFSHILTTSKSKLITILQEQEILEQIQSKDFAQLPILINSYTYSILKAMQVKDVPEVEMDRCLAFVQSEIKRLAFMEKDQNIDEQFTQHVPWWINGAIEAFREKQKTKGYNDNHTFQIPENLLTL